MKLIAKFSLVLMFCAQGAFSASLKEDVTMDYSVKVEKFFNEFNKDKLDLVYDFYSSDTHFEDPIGSHEGVESVKAYYANLYKNVQDIRFDFTNHICAKNQCVSAWTMHLTTEKLNGGKPISVDGNSIFKFNDTGKAIYHRDYFDMGAFIYEQVPILKNIISYIKNQLK